MTKERKQEVFNNFVTLTHGKGQSLSLHEECAYFPEDHVGCAIGCQPGFREKFSDPDLEGNSIVSLMQDYKEIREFFDVDIVEVDDDGGLSEDAEFLHAMQRFHDERKNWDKRGEFLIPEKVRAFCKEHGLEVPEKFREG